MDRPRKANAVHMTAQGWQIVPRGGVPFVRSGSTHPLPIPVKGGDIRELQSVLNVQPEDFVLVAGWQLQVLNPEGPYPLLAIEGGSTNGKTTASKTILWTVDNNPTGLRSARTENDLYIGARNNHAVGFDNLSSMPANMADTLCKLSTGIAVGARRLYTDDEEHAFYAIRPILFNGIPTDLAERTDLATRVIRLYIPPIPAKLRRGDKELKAAFEEMGPRVLGALCDGLVGALRNEAGIKIEEPARLADFERFAEAGCRAMGFTDWTFVNRYKQNREGSMQFAADASPVGRAVQRFLASSRKGYSGDMTGLYSKLETWRERTVADRDWPKDAARLSTALRGLRQALAGKGIDLEVEVDLRPNGPQHGVTVHWREEKIAIAPAASAAAGVLQFRRRL
jgi:putative DNA primase/helicase